ncbi:hypothetical protein [Thiorhodovibrio frisius]|uniref:hypothetical protein n=1 Tax=Thiorhodovibrio frisius TaxID=631362 RepID=UPI00022C6C52|nr:hypothetical protein [Thiorhodovibrio frisius]WPL20204.1 hypothetical protein Thiofri_00276 [Thiorhodovibrio frisius]
MAATPPDEAQLTQSRGQRQLKEGKAIESEEENRAELNKQAEVFAAKRLPMLKALGVV